MDYSPDNPYIDFVANTRYMRKRKNVLLRSFEILKIAKEHKILLSSDDMRIILNHTGKPRLGSSRGLNKGDVEVTSRQVGQYLGYMKRKGILFRVKGSVYNIYANRGQFYKLYGLKDGNGWTDPLEWNQSISGKRWKKDEWGNYSLE